MHRRSAAISAMCVVTALSIGACTGSKAGVGDAASTGSTAGDAKLGGTLTVAMQAPAVGVNPATVNGAFGNYTALDYDTLLRADYQGKISAGLASAWAMSDNNQTLTLTLRSGVTFSDGSAVDAAAVKKSLDYMRANSSVASLYTDITSVDVVDASHVTVKTSQPDSQLPTAMAGLLGEVISPKGVDGIKGLTVDAPSAGAGAYVLDPKASLSGDHYTYTLNPSYYDKSRQHWKKIVLKVVTDPQAAVNALSTGQVQQATGDFTTAKQAAGAGLQIAYKPTIWFGFNLIDRGGEVSKPLGDARVRQAINYAIDRATLEKATLGDYGAVTDQPSAKGDNGYSEAAATRYPYDPAKAKALLAQAGYADGFDLPVLSVHFEGLDQLTEAVKAMLDPIGIHLKPNYVSDEQSYAGGSTDRKWPVVAVGYGSQPMDQMAKGLFLPTAKAFNGFGTVSPELQRYFDASLTATTDADRNAQYVKMEDWVVENAWFAPVMDVPVFSYAAKNLGGVENPDGSPDGNALDWYQTTAS
ncbi:ABC transporter substrate-binding protein [Catenulispora subtropica]|uniref:ABC transporter substrate-binding protein n=1 Tax=Catenulispora subtropica TaxID=450798 RepID=A0ABN2QCF4_9ACTN